MLSPESAASLTEIVLRGSESERADAFFLLVKDLAGPEPPPNAPIEQKQRYDAAYAVLRKTFPNTTACEDAFSVEIGSENVISLSELAA